MWIAEELIAKGYKVMLLAKKIWRYCDIQLESHIAPISIPFLMESKPVWVSTSKHFRSIEGITSSQG